MTGEGEIGPRTHPSTGLGLPLGACLASQGPQATPCLRSVPSYLDIIEQAISAGDTLLIENIGETVDPVLDPLLGRNTIKKGR
jgi:hypothetical protein